MKHSILTAAVLGAALASTSGASAREALENVIHVYDDVVFFDGYNRLENLNDKAKAMIPDDDGILRHLTSLYAVKLSDEQLAQVGEHLDMRVMIGAMCDNYDRIGNINLAFVPKGSATYTPSEVKRIELGRFITPFMNKNKEPKEVPYVYEVDNVSGILRDARLREEFDIWVEFQLFGIPYAANEQVKGCADCQDVFAGTLWFETDAPAPVTDKNVLVPIVIKKPEDQGKNLCNYDESATDVLGKTQKKYTFEVPEDVTDSEIVLITSNHGANAGGEEYNRRVHVVRFQDEIVLRYTPGRDSCEPFRKYNTQLNGIYGYSAKSDAEWQSFSNWCPGDVIDNRIINLGPLAKGTYTVEIKVPKAVFPEKQGDIPVSMYFQGVTEGKLPQPSGLNEVKVDFRSSISVEGDVCRVASEETPLSIAVYNADGELIDRRMRASEISLAACPKGVNIVVVEYADGLNENYKVLR